MLLFLAFVFSLFLLACSNQIKPDEKIEISVNNKKVESYIFNGVTTIPLEGVCNILGYHNRKYNQGASSKKIFVSSKNNYIYFYPDKDYYSVRDNNLEGKLQQNEAENHSNQEIEKSYNKKKFENGFKAIHYGGYLYVPIDIVDKESGLEMKVQYLDNGYRIGEYN
ncbi:MAG: hypothetical protein RR515_00290 [Clostridium sp.]